MKGKRIFKNPSKGSDSYSYGQGLRHLLLSSSVRWRRVDHSLSYLPFSSETRVFGLTKSEGQLMANNGDFRRGSTEQEYFFRLNKELIEKFKAKVEKQKQQVEEQACKELHWMKCPRCGHDLKNQDFGALVVDQCDDCGGVFLDKTEVDYLIDMQDHNSLSTIFSGLLSPKKKGA